MGGHHRGSAATSLASCAHIALRPSACTGPAILARSSPIKTTYQMGLVRTLNVAASMISDVYDQPAEQAPRKTTRKPRVNANPHPTQSSCSSAEGNGPISAIL